IFEDIDTSVTGIAAYAGGAAEQLRGQLLGVQAAANEAMEKYNPLRPNAVTDVIARGLKQLRAMRAKLESDAQLNRKDPSRPSALKMSQTEFAETDFLLEQKEADFVDALLKSEGVVIDCLADDEIVTPGQTFSVTLSVYANSGAKLAGFG